MSTNPASIIKIFAGDRHTRDWISGFFLLGILAGFIGPLFISWQYHIDTNPQLIGLHFLALTAGCALALATSRRLLLRFPIRSVAIVSCAVAFLSLLGLSFLAPPVAVIWRMAGLWFIGLAGGELAASLLYPLEPHLSRSSKATINLAGCLFGLGCTTVTVITALIYFAGSVQLEAALLSVFPLTFAFLLMTNRLPSGRQPFRLCEEQEHHFQALRESRSIRITLFQLLIFFQSGNEFILAGWLPLLLIGRFGANPVFAMLTLVAYFLALTAGRVVAGNLLRYVGRRWCLISGAAMAITGYLILSLTSSMTGACIAVVLISFGFAPVYPLLPETLDSRFFQHAGFYHRVFLIALIGAMSTPWFFGYVYSFFGIRYTMLIPAFGSIAVLILALLMMLKVQLMECKQQEKPRVLTAAAGKH